jgi:2-isopropylmalate synthase
MEHLNKIELFDTTLRDGTQSEGVNLSVHDKVLILQKLDDFGIDIVEGGWPGSNPKDMEFFERVKQMDLKNARICAFGSTARYPDKISTDNNLLALIKADTPVVSIFGKTWKFHAEKGMGLTEQENEELILSSILFLKDHGKTVIFDAEHFFDGFKSDEEFALRMLKAAEKSGADVIALCDTNGGSLPSEVYNIVSKVKKIINTPIGIHAHNDGELGVANSLIAVDAGAVHVQGTINGLGERCGNANLASIIPNLVLKMNKKVNPQIELSHLTSLSHFIAEILNVVPNTHAPFVGKSAFAHKGGIHVSAVLKDSRMYEHIIPTTVGNKRRVLVSDLSGKSNIEYKANELGVSINGNKDLSKKLVSYIKTLEYDGYQFDGAEASFELLLATETKEFSPFFKLLDSKVNVMFDNEGNTSSEAVLKIEVDGEVEHTADNGVGPVDALNNALRKALVRFYPEVLSLKLIDYKVRVLNEKKGTAAKVRVLIETSDGVDIWSTVGVSENIIEASWLALSDSMNHKLFKLQKDKTLKMI